MSVPQLIHDKWSASNTQIGCSLALNPPPLSYITPSNKADRAKE